MTDAPQGEGLLSFDFDTRFPHRFWISDWTSDASYPDGFRYKLLSGRDTASDDIEFLIVVEAVNGAKTILKHYDVTASAFDRTARTFVEGLAEEHRLDFRLLDLSEVRTPEEFERRVTEAGWREIKV